MPEKTPPAYSWAVSLAADPGHGFTVEAAYPVLADDGFMLLKDSDHKIVFAAAPKTGCTFTRGEPSAPGPVSVTGGFPPGCACAYTGTWSSGVMAGRWERNVNWACKADHAEIDQLAVVTAESTPADCCPHRIPKTVRCHECSPVIAPGAQAGEDAKAVKAGVIPASEVRKMRYGLDEGEAGGGVRL
jgi:hypothetical protein